MFFVLPFLPFLALYIFAAVLPAVILLRYIYRTDTVEKEPPGLLVLLLLMGVVFQLPVIVFVLARLGFVSSALLATYRKHAFLVIMVVAAIITPPVLMTLLLVSLPLYVLYEVSIRVARWVEK